MSIWANEDRNQRPVGSNLDLSLRPSLTFRNSFILVKVLVEPEPIPGTMALSQECTQDGTLVHYRAPYTHIHSQGQFILAYRMFWVGAKGNWITLRNPTRTQHAKKLHTDSNQGPQCCQVEMLPLRHTCYNKSQTFFRPLKPSLLRQNQKYFEH